MVAPKDLTLKTLIKAWGASNCGPDCKCTQAHCNCMLANPALWVSAGPFYPLSYLFRSHTNTHLQTQSCSCCWFESMPSLIWNKSNTTCLGFLMRLSAMNGLTPRWNKGLSYVNWPCFLRFLLTPLLMMEGSNRKFTVLADTYMHTCGKKKKKRTEEKEAILVPDGEVLRCMCKQSSMHTKGRKNRQQKKSFTNFGSTCLFFLFVYIL